MKKSVRIAIAAVVIVGSYFVITHKEQADTKATAATTACKILSEKVLPQFGELLGVSPTCKEIVDLREDGDDHHWKADAVLADDHVLPVLIGATERNDGHLYITVKLDN